MRFQTLPHKNLIISAAIALGIFLFALFSINKDGAVYDKNGAAVAQASPKSTLSSADIDTDRDLLPDWKEQLYGSNLNIPDTDRDGTSDGDEVRSNRNPVVPNTAKDGESPNDRLAYLLDPNFATSSEDTLDARKEFFARQLAEGGRDIRETTFMNLIERVNVKPFVAKNEITSLKISSDNSPEGVKKFVNAFGVIIKKYSINPVSRTEDEVLRDTLTKKDSSTKSDLQIIAITYKNFAHDLLGLNTPSQLAKAHLLIVNGYAGMSEGLFALDVIQQKPLDGAAGYEAYLKSRLDVTKGYLQIVSYVAKNAIAFDASEPGYPFARFPSVNNKLHASR